MSLKEGQQKGRRIASQIHPKLTPITTRNAQEQKSIATFKRSLLQIHHQRQQTQNAYEKVIFALEEVIEQLFKKNDCLIQQKQSLVKQNYNLRKNNESLTNIIEVKKRLGQSVIVQNSEIFQILVDTSSIERGTFKNQESIEGGNTIGNILEENSCIANRQEFIIMSNPLSQNISQYEENEISMSNIGRTQTVHPTNLQTPGLHKENIYVQSSSKTSEGIIRAFYLSVMQKKATAKHLIQVIQSLKYDMTTVIFQPYPTNEFWIDMLCNFLRIAHDNHFETQVEVLQYIKFHRLIDTLMIKCLKSRIQFLFSSLDSFQIPSAPQILGALANQFGLRMEVIENQYIFFTKQVKEQNLLSNDRASLEISLNNKDQNIYYVKEEEPSFTITEIEDYLQFTFFIVVECELGISQYEINQESLGKDQSFRCQGFYNESVQLGQNEFDLRLGGKGDHLEGIASILNERDMNIFQAEEKKLTRNYGHRRYTQTQATPKNCKEPLNSSRFFLNRVASKHSSVDQNA